MKIVRGIVKWIRQLFGIKGTKSNVQLKTKKQWRFNMMRINGTVKFFNHEKGFGFISMGNKDIFVHANGLNDGVSIDQGDQVEFAVGQGRKGDMAIEVSMLKKAEPKPDRRERRDRRDFNRGNNAGF